MVGARPLQLALLVSLGGCAPGGAKIPEVQDGELLAAAFEQLQFERAAQIVPFRPDVLAQLAELVDEAAWRPRPGGFRDVTMNACPCRVEDRRFYFVSRQTRYVTKQHDLHWLEVGSGRPSRPVAAGIPLLPDDRPLPFGVRPVPGGLVVVHADTSRILEVRGRLVRGGLEFAAPQVIFETVESVLDLQLVDTEEHLHLLWSNADPQGRNGSVHCASSPKSHTAWGPPHHFTDSVERGTASMAAGDDELYVAWGDHRFARRHADGRLGNTAKAYLTVSRDGGRTFRQPRLVHDPRQEGDIARDLCIAVGRGGLAMFWRLAGEEAGWRSAAFSADLRRMVRGPAVPEARLVALFLARLEATF